MTRYTAFEYVPAESYREGFWKQTWDGPDLTHCSEFAQAPLTQSGLRRAAVVFGYNPHTLPTPHAVTHLEALPKQFTLIAEYPAI